MVGREFDAIMSKSLEHLAYAIRSCEIKSSIVEQDERESGIRAILNFGHTFGHAIESGFGYGNWLHERQYQLVWC